MRGYFCSFVASALINTSSMPKNSFFIVLVPYFRGGVFLLSLLSVSCSNSLDDIKRVDIGDAQNIEKAQDVEIFYSDSAIVRLRITADEMRNVLDRENPKRDFPKGIWVDFFDMRGQKTSELTAKYAEYKEIERMIELRDSVVLWNEKNEKLETEQLFWNEKDGRIYSNKFVKITTFSEIITGYGFSSNMEFSQWEIDSVSGIFPASTFMNEKPNFGR